MITIIARNGPPEAMLCPAILCDGCLQPIHKQGNALWVPDHDEDGTYTVLQFAFTHKECNYAFEMASGLRHHWYSEELDVFLRHLSNNFARPFTREANVEYVAPAPSTWRLGHYDRSPA